MHFPFNIRISILGLQHTNAAQVLSDFITLVRQKYEVEVISEITCNCAHSQAEVTLAVPFSERETVRIDFNIFASEFDTLHPSETTSYFKLESA
ncbi:MAG: hypothetical protein II806_02620 [Bacteroidaceae bacterium]|nr:hypothetical protein [Bacteroidaceae bacterium]